MEVIVKIPDRMAELLHYWHFNRSEDGEGLENGSVLLKMICRNELRSVDEFLHKEVVDQLTEEVNDACSDEKIVELCETIAGLRFLQFRINSGIGPYNEKQIEI